MTAYSIAGAILAAVGSTLLFACSGPQEAERDPTSAVPQESTQAAGSGAPAVPANHAESLTKGGDGSTIRLTPLSSEEIGAADLSGELGCSFESGKRDILLVAMGDVSSEEPSIGVVKVGDYVESISARGGFDGMLKGATFVGRGKTILVERTSSHPLGGGEAPPYPARLTFQRADSASRGFDGIWTCGP